MELAISRAVGFSEIQGTFLLSSQVLVHYDSKLEIVLACDASCYGIGAVLTHKMPVGSEKPIGFTSRTLSSADKQCSQSVFGVKHFHDYLIGRHFSLVTDHCPLLALFNEQSAKCYPQSFFSMQTKLGTDSGSVRVHPYCLKN